MLVSLPKVIMEGVYVVDERKMMASRDRMDPVVLLLLVLSLLALENLP